ncbi:MAG: sodium/solute symporter [Myxococcota bacterium]|nr:sodium/solute symporter [Myxococcota bacterium]
MSAIDWVVIITYLGAMVAFSVYLGRGQESQEDYYVGGRSLPWWAIGISTMATQSSANSFLGIPAFVALKEGGGLTWLQYELALPIAMIFVMVVLLPFFRQLELVSVYEYLELRFGRPTRLFLSGVFLVSRALATGMGIYAAAIVLTVCLGIPIWATILIIGVVTIIYDTIGGMAAVVYSDVIQMGVLVVGIILCIFFAAEISGGWGELFSSLPAERWRALDFSTGLTSTGAGSGSETPFWGFLIGGFFLYVSYYGVDQSQAQRELSAPTIEDTKRSLVLNGLARLPITLLYLFLGIALGAAYQQLPELQAAVDAHGDRIDFLVPEFILTQLPVGIRAVLISAILAAAMSSLDSALNSLSAATMRDFLEEKIEPARRLVVGKVVTVIWGIVITGFAFLFVYDEGSKSVVESINQIGSAFYGPILAAFCMGLLSRRSNGVGVIGGTLAGVAFNVYLWVAHPQIFWMWWNLFGLVVTCLVTWLLSRLSAAPAEAQVDQYTLQLGALRERERPWIKTYIGLTLYSLLIGGIAYICTSFAL